MYDSLWIGLPSVRTVHESSYLVSLGHVFVLRHHLLNKH